MDIHQVEQIIVDWNHINDYFEIELISDSVQIIPLPNIEKCLIGEIKDVIYKDHLIFIEDELTKTVFIFDSLLNYRSKINYLGRGVGEYLSITGVAIADSSVFIYDHISRKINLYSYEGEFLSSVSVLGWGSGMFAIDSLLYLVNDWSTSNLGNYRLFGYNLKDGKVIFTSLPFLKQDEIRGWGIDRHFSVLGKEALVFYSSCDTLFKVRGQEIFPVYSIDYGRKKLPESILKEDGHKVLKYAMKNPEFTMGLNNLGETKDFILIRTEEKFIVYDKIKKVTQVYNTLLNSKLESDNIWDFKISGNKLFSWVSASEFKSKWEYDLKERVFVDRLKKEEYRKIVENIQEDSNPILYIYHLK